MHIYDVKSLLFDWKSLLVDGKKYSAKAVITIHFVQFVEIAKLLL